MDTIVLAGGCFWGMEDLFRKQKGVIGTRVGYTGGRSDNPTYEFHPGHAETVEITFDINKTSLAELLDYFFNIHDPTTINRQGNDIGESYRSAVFFASKEQLAAAMSAIDRASRLWSDKIQTSLEVLNKFWPAEDYHQQYLRINPGGYTCHYERR